MTLVMSKKHFDSDPFLMPDADYVKLLQATKKVSEILKKGLEVYRVAMVAEGMGVNHVHIKLYPLYGVEKEFKETYKKISLNMDQIEFQREVGRLEVIGELLIREK